MPSTTNTAVDAAQAARDAAYTAWAAIDPKIEATKAALTASTPAAAVAAGTDLLAAAETVAIGERKLEFLHNAREEAWKILLVKEAELKTAQAESRWEIRLPEAISKRLLAVKTIEDSKAAIVQAELDYRAATAKISAAFADGCSKPFWFSREPLDLAHTVIPHPVPQYRSAEEEAELWGIRQ